MKWLKATDSQKLILDQLEFGPHKIEFIKTSKGWLVGAHVLDNCSYAPFLTILQKLEVIEYDLPIPSEGGFFSNMWTGVKDFFS